MYALLMLCSRYSTGTEAACLCSSERTSWPRRLLPPAASPCNRGLPSIVNECARMRLLRMLCPVPGARCPYRYLPLTMGPPGTFQQRRFLSTSPMAPRSTLSLAAT
jgi:hypothetical protein